MSLLQKKALPHLEAGHYTAVVLSYEEKTTPISAANPIPKEYVQVILQVQNPARPLTVNLFETGFEIAINALSRQFRLRTELDAISILNMATATPFEITIEDTAYRNVHFYHKELTPPQQQVTTTTPVAYDTDF